ncbi:hypothetical protein ABZS76_18705 [Streptomyces sp. NPDC005562]|uniref:hypothetical protein n=1 Tax=Streptomyces sp. NPDC005562 TaxID=3154890 RepID=UPI0033A666A8
MSEPTPGTAEPEAETGEALRSCHAARATSAASRAAAVFHHIERHPHTPDAAADTGRPQGEPPRDKTLWKAEHAARVSVQALAVLAESAPDPAADSRCARNAAASAAQAAQMGQAHDGDGEDAVAACRAALRASQAAAAAAGRGALGTDPALNAAADEAEAAAVAAAERAGWMRPGQRLPEVRAGMRSPELMSMMHF